jgi:hypothetical protein
VAILTHDLVSHRPRACAVAQETVLHLRVLPTQHFSRARADFKKGNVVFLVKVIGSPFSLAKRNPFLKVAEELFIRKVVKTNSFLPIYSYSIQNAPQYYWWVWP